MTTINQKRPLILLGFGFVASLVAYSHALGPYLTFEGEGPIGQILTLFLFPITATVIYSLIGSLRASRAVLPADPATLTGPAERLVAHQHGNPVGLPKIAQARRQSGKVGTDRPRLLVHRVRSKVVAE